MKQILSILLTILLGTVALSAQTWLITTADQVADGSSGTFAGVGPGDTVWLSAGVRDCLLLKNFHGAPGQPVVFANHGGQVILDTDYHYGIDLRFSSHIKFVGIPGNGYDYGIFIRRVGGGGSVGLSANNLSTNVEISHVEITQTGFAGLMAKTEPNCTYPATLRGNFIQYNTRVHDCYIHDVPGEGMYIGSSFYNGQHISGCGTLLPPVLEGVYVYHNRIEHTGYDGIQVSSAVKDCYIYDNYVKDCSYLQQTGQMSGIIIGGGTKADCYANTIIDPYGTGILLFGKGGTRIFNNVIIRAAQRYAPGDPDKREHGIFVSDKTGDASTFYGIYQNTIIQSKSDGIRINSDVHFRVEVFNNAIVDPGAYTVYENDQTSRTGQDAFVFITDPNVTPVVLSGNQYHRTLSSAGFVNPGADDYRPDSGSPLIDAGIDLSAYGIVTDHDGFQRPNGSGYDVGAYEHYSDYVDLYIQNLSITPQIADPGETLTVSGQAGNRGDLDVSTDYRLKVYLSDNISVSEDDRLLENRAYIRFAAGATENFSGYQYTLPDTIHTGTWYLLFFLDADQSIPEINEDNNLAWVPLTILPASYPDLYLRNLSVTPAFLSTGETFSLSVVAGNRGNAPVELYYEVMIALSKDTIYSPDDFTLERFDHNPYPAGYQEVLNRGGYRIPPETSPGDWYLIMIMDFNRVVDESDETNNTAIAPLQVQTAASVDEMNWLTEPFIFQGVRSLGSYSVGIDFRIRHECHIMIRVSDLNGRVIVEQTDYQGSPGSMSIKVNLPAAGIYLIQANSLNYRDSYKFVIL
ncbi:MAG: right-handed parallel beta-helix repeat-containing protein [Bacteroidales bacterium]|nr:right-handed parallel beta-helix repeat-containing protein [Bacteroidales bacterium]